MPAKALHQPLWFRVTLAGAVGLGFWGLYKWRVRRIAALLNARCDERMAERNRVAGDLHDTFLQSVQASRMIADAALFDEAADPVQLRRAMLTLSDFLAHAVADGQTALEALRG